ncbi:MAG: alcohol dehydrogenase [Actinobacteria bacterium]|nr:MAG: alcohol dehydrogenase [Actinomycetota bacterium]RIK06280.1 MAG: alcohol dehydrogenase [Acidobacteriota bacterium]
MTAPGPGRVRAAVIEEVAGEFEVQELELREPEAGEVVVRLSATALCRSDAHVALTGEGIRFPAVLGHEGAGIIERVGRGSRHQPGTAVVLSWTPRCGRCPRCREGRPQLCQELSTCPSGGCLSRGDVIMGTYMGLGCLAEAIVVPDACAVPVPEGLDPEHLCMLGCGVMTGFGAAVNAAGATVGSSVAVVGCGAVGLAAIQAARIAGARLVIAVDPVGSRRVLAGQLGAQHTIDPAAVDPFAEILAISGGGVDGVIEATGEPEVMRRILEAVHPGGTAVVVGLPPLATTLEVWPFHLLLEKRLTGSIYGSADPQRDFPVLADLYSQGRLHLAELTGSRYPLEDVNEAMADLRDHRAPRPIVTFEKSEPAGHSGA